MADNADHNTCTLDGNNTFHGMGIISACTPASTAKRIPLPRRNVSNEEIANASRIDINYYHEKESTGLAKMNFEELIHIHHIPDPAASFNIIWKSSLMLKCERPGWNGLMQLIHKGRHPGKASVMFLPMIDLNPSDMSCIYTTLHFVSAQAEKYHCHPIVTFDQPLWFKALQIITSEEDTSPIASIVLILGGFHTEMSYLGAIGHTMQGSGLEELLESIYAKNTIPHMLSGKAISRATRGHYIVDSALNALLISQAYGLPLPLLPENAETEDGTTTEDYPLPDELQTAKDLLHRILNGDNSLSTTDVNMLNKIKQKIEDEKAKLHDHRTALLWLQYMSQVDILKSFKTGERTGNWRLTLSSSKDMIEYLAATGHNNYTRSLHIHLQRMQRLTCYTKI